MQRKKPGLIPAEPLFAPGSLVEAQWRIVEPVLGNVTPFYTYLPGTWGPEEAVQLMASDGPWSDPMVREEEKQVGIVNRICGERAAVSGLRPEVLRQAAPS
jgi:hypothetical protein